MDRQSLSQTEKKKKCIDQNTVPQPLLQTEKKCSDKNTLPGKKFIDQNTLPQSLSQNGKKVHWSKYTYTVFVRDWKNVINQYTLLHCLSQTEKKCIDQEILLQSLSQTRITDQDSELISKFTTRLNSLSTVLSNSNPRGRLLCMIRTQPSSTNSPQDWTAWRQLEPTAISVTDYNYRLSSRRGLLQQIHYRIRQLNDSCHQHDPCQN